MATKVREETVLTVPNHHIEMCGKPPELVADNKYTAYFENRHGEQLVFQYDQENHKGTLWHGDYSWEHPVEVFAGRPVELILDKQEGDWLDLVWEVATEFEPEEVKVKSALNLAQGGIAYLDKMLAHPALKDAPVWLQAFAKQKKKYQQDEQVLKEKLNKEVSNG